MPCPKLRDSFCTASLGSLDRRLSAEIADTCRNHIPHWLKPPTSWASWSKAPTKPHSPCLLMPDSIADLGSGTPNHASMLQIATLSGGSSSGMLQSAEWFPTFKLLFEQNHLEDCPYPRRPPLDRPQTHGCFPCINLARWSAVSCKEVRLTRE